MATLKIDGIEKTLSGKKILNNISLEIEEETFTTILGPAGAGKTTLLKIISGTLKPDKGTIYLGDRDITNIRPRFRRVAMVSQGYNLYPNLTAYENIASPLRAQKKPDAEVEKRVQAQAELLHISELLDKRPYELSGGQCQRVALGRALIKEADIYLLDEPLTGLDYKLREEMTHELKEILNAEHFKKVVLLYAAPNYEEALSMSTKTIILKDGTALWHGDTLEAYRRPPTLDVAQNFCSPPMNLFESRLMKDNGEIFLYASDEIRLRATHLKNELNEQEYMMGLQTHTFHFEENQPGLTPITFNLSLADVTPAGTILHLEYNGQPMSGYFHYPKDFKRGVLTLFVNPEDFFIFGKESGKLIMKYRSAKEWRG
jgi:ABC-type sugar transport system ATPase subunit